MTNERNYNSIYTDPYEDGLYEEKKECAQNILLSSILDIYENRLEELLKPLTNEIKEQYIQSFVELFDDPHLELDNLEGFIVEIRNAKKYADIRRATEDDDLFVEFIDKIENTNLEDDLYSLIISENNLDDLRNW